MRAGTHRAASCRMRELEGKKVGAATQQEHDAAHHPVIGKATQPEGELAPRASAFEGARWEDVNRSLLAKSSRADSDAAIKKLAKVGEKLLKEAIAGILKFLGKFSEYSSASADAAKNGLKKLAKTCRPGTPGLEVAVNALAAVFSSFHFAKLLRSALSALVAMSKAMHALAKKGRSGLGDFVKAAMSSAKSWSDAVTGHVRAISEVDRLVHDIRARCGKPLVLAVPERIKPHVTEKPKLRLHLDPKISPRGPVITLPGFPLLGGKTVVPRELELDRGPVILQTVA